MKPRPKPEPWAMRVLHSIAARTGVTLADMKRITPTHVETYNHRKIPHNMHNIPETIDLRKFDLT